MQFRLSNSQQYIVVGLVGLVGLALLLTVTISVSVRVSIKYCCEFDNLNCIYADHAILTN